jgi:type VI secretion system FHA domain protein
MTLILTVRNTQVLDAGIPREFMIEGKSATIGRSASCDWTLPDSKNHISSRHAEIALTDHGYILKDTSTNGIFVNGGADRLAGEHKLVEGDVLRIGHYEIAVHKGVKNDGVPLKKPKEKKEAKAEAPSPPAPPPPPPPAPPPPPPPPPPPTEPERTVFQAEPVAAAPERTIFQPAAEANDTPADDGEELSAEQQALWEKVSAANAVDWDRGGFGADGGEALAQAMVAATADELAAAFLASAGIEADKVKVPAPEAIAKGGSLLRRLVAGLVIMVESRARAKAQMGAEATQLQLDGNNPIKFARTPQGALTQLINPTMSGFQDAEKAVEDAFLDIQSHQVATMSAIPGALRTTLERFSPGSIKRRAENMGILQRILPTARDAALWANYEREFKAVAKQSDEAFMEVFSKEFRKAYARQMAKNKG